MPSNSEKLVDYVLRTQAKPAIGEAIQSYDQGIKLTAESIKLLAQAKTLLRVVMYSDELANQEDGTIPDLVGITSDLVAQAENLSWKLDENFTALGIRLSDARALAGAEKSPPPNK